MREIVIEEPGMTDNEVDEELENWESVDWKQASPEVFEAIDKQLKPHGLELVMGMMGDDQFWFKVAKRGK